MDPGHETKRQTLRIAGVSIMVVGGILLAIGLVDFFRSLNSFEGPKLFWMVFVGLLLFGLGAKLAGAGFLGAFARYGAAEVTPVAKDALEYLKDPSHSSDDLVACGSCGTGNRPDARFCDSCGAAMGTVCSGCGTRNEAGSKFCDNCGNALVTLS